MANTSKIDSVAGSANNDKVDVNKFCCLFYKLLNLLTLLPRVQS